MGVSVYVYEWVYLGWGGVRGRGDSRYTHRLDEVTVGTHTDFRCPSHRLSTRVGGLGCGERVGRVRADQPRASLLLPRTPAFAPLSQSPSVIVFVRAREGECPSVCSLARIWASIYDPEGFNSLSAFSDK